jgi:hypothetical protein
MTAGYRAYDFYKNYMNIDRKKYNEKTLEIVKEYEKNLGETEKINEIIQNLNKKIASLRWNEYIVFENVKYGIPPMTNVHNEYDCKGLPYLYPVFDEYTKSVFIVYKCQKCGAEVQEIVNSVHLSANTEKKSKK